MKVIDLLNKIANRELAFEQEFKHNGFITDMEMFCEDYYFNEEILNSPIELIEQKEEDKEIEKINSIKVPTISNSREKNIENIEETLNKYWFVINKLTEAVNELKKGK